MDDRITEEVSALFEGVFDEYLVVLEHNLFRLAAHY